MNDSEALERIERMSRFILQEAAEKKAEIEKKTAEDIEAEKWATANAARQRIREEFGKRFKHIESARKIRRANYANQARLDYMAAKEAAIANAVDVAIERLEMEVVTDAARYRDVMTNILMEALVTLMEPSVYVQVREEDKDLVSELIPVVTDTLRAQTGLQTAIQIDEEPLDAIGGVIMRDATRRITADNTLESKVSRTYKHLAPRVKALMFQGLSEPEL